MSYVRIGAAIANSEIALPADALVFGEPVQVTAIRYDGNVRRDVRFDLAAVEGGKTWDELEGADA
jgi:hypothetical protein